MLISQYVLLFLTNDPPHGRCEKELSFLPRPLERRLASHKPGDSLDKEETVRVLSWNLLSQGGHDIMF